MEKFKVAVLGLGNHGHSWASSVVPSCVACAKLAAVIEKQTEKWEGIAEDVPKYQDLDQALEEQRIDLVVNVTPPMHHSAINEHLLRKGIAVLCEKPIADSYANAKRMIPVLKETGGFLMIGENYRYHTVFREAKRILDFSDLGKIHHMLCHFRHYHPDYSMFYHGALEHPILEDVAIHHLDLARYLSSQEPQEIWCQEMGANYCWYGQRPATVFLSTRMSNEVMFHYNGTLASPESTTDWNGDWEIECDNGVLQICGTRILVYRGGQVEKIEVKVEEEDSRIELLRETCRALQEGRRGETDFYDNLKSFRWMCAAILSAKRQGWVCVEEIEGEEEYED